MRHLIGAASIQARYQGGLQALQDLRGVGPNIWRKRYTPFGIGIFLQAVLYQLRGQQFQPLPGVARVAPCLIAQLLQHGGPRASPGLRPLGTQDIKTIDMVQTQVLCQSNQKAPLPCSLATGKAGQCNQGVNALATLRRATQNMQAIADLRLFDFTQVGVQTAQQGLTPCIVDRLCKTQLMVQVVLQHAVQNAGSQQLGTAGIQ